MIRKTHAVVVLVAAGMLAACSATDSSSKDTTAAATTTAAAPAPTEAASDTAAPDTASPDTAAPGETTAATEATEATEAPTTTDPGPPQDIVYGFGASSGDPNAIREKYGVAGMNSSLDGEHLLIAMIDDLNAKGGAHGHTIVPMPYEQPSGDIAADVLDQQRCEYYFGGDTKALIVRGDKTPILNDCATQNGAIVIGAGLTGVDEATLEAMPSYLNPQAPTSDRMAQAMVDLAVARGVITEGTSVGIISQDCADTQTIVDDSLTPALEAAGATVTAFAVTCMVTAADQGAAIAQIPAAILQMKKANVSVIADIDRGFIGTALLMNEANTQGLTPTWLLATTHEIGGLTSMSPPEEQLAKVLAVGWSPVLDVGEVDVSKLGAEAVACVDLAVSLGFNEPANLGEVAVLLSTCSDLNVIQALVADTPGALDRDSMLASLAGTTDQLSLLAGSTDWSLGREPVDSYRPVVYDPATKAFVYDGDAVPFSS